MPAQLGPRTFCPGTVGPRAVCLYSSASIHAACLGSSVGIHVAHLGGGGEEGREKLSRAVDGGATASAAYASR